MNHLEEWGHYDTVDRQTGIEQNEVTAICPMPPGHARHGLVASVTSSGEICVWNSLSEEHDKDVLWLQDYVVSETVESALDSDLGFTLPLAFSPNGDVLAVGCDEETASFHLFDVVTGDLLETVTNGAEMASSIRGALWWLHYK